MILTYGSKIGFPRYLGRLLLENFTMSLTLNFFPPESPFLGAFPMHLFTSFTYSFDNDVQMKVSLMLFFSLIQVNQF